MRGKLLFVAGAAVGYVLGARAGRQRYEQIKSAAESLWNTPTVQKGVDQVTDFAKARVGDVSDSVLDTVKSLINSATQSKSAPAPAPVPPRPTAARPDPAAPTSPAAPGPTTTKPAATKPATTKPAPKAKPKPKTGGSASDSE